MMHMHSTPWGHIGTSEPVTAIMEEAEELAECAMLRCRFGRVEHQSPFPPMQVMPANIRNPRTLQDLAAIFHTSFDYA